MEREWIVDELGRVVLPYKARAQLGIAARDGLHITVEEERIILENPKKPRCIFCKGTEELTPFMDMPVYRGCRSRIARAPIECA